MHKSSLNSTFAGCLNPAILAVCLFWCISAQAQDSAPEPAPINTERPSFSSSPVALGVGYWQIEAGYQFSHSGRSKRSEEHSYPNSLLRFGLRDHLELQLNWAGYSSTRSSDGTTSGYKDTSLGVKWQILDQGRKFVAALYAGLSMPMGSGNLSSSETDPEAALFWTYQGTLDWFGTAKYSDSGDRYKLENAVGINLSLGEITGAYVEYKGTFPEGAGPVHDLNLGLTWLLDPSFQVDLNGGVGLNSRATDYFIGTGFAVRF